MTDTDLELVARLRELAKAASPGPWTFTEDYRREGVRVEDGRGYPLLTVGYAGDYSGSAWAEWCEPADGKYIAAANPKAITELCDDRDAWKARAEAAEEQCKGFAAAVNRYVGDSERAKAERRAEAAEQRLAEAERLLGRARAVGELSPYVHSSIDDFLQYKATP